MQTSVTLVVHKSRTRRRKKAYVDPLSSKSPFNKITTRIVSPSCIYSTTTFACAAVQTCRQTHPSETGDDSMNNKTDILFVFSPAVHRLRALVGPTAVVERHHHAPEVARCLRSSDANHRPELDALHQHVRLKRRKEDGSKNPGKIQATSRCGSWDTCIELGRADFFSLSFFAGQRRHGGGPHGPIRGRVVYMHRRRTNLAASGARLAWFLRGGLWGGGFISPQGVAHSL